WTWTRPLGGRPPGPPGRVRAGVRPAPAGRDAVRLTGPGLRGPPPVGAGRPGAAHTDRPGPRARPGQVDGEPAGRPARGPRLGRAPPQRGRRPLAPGLAPPRRRPHR